MSGFRGCESGVGTGVEICTLELMAVSSSSASSEPGKASGRKERGLQRNACFSVDL